MTPVLKWVAAAKEPEIREAFRHASIVRGQGPDAKALADRFFFETLVRIHREGEGAPYTGLKPAGVPVDPGIAASDAALETGTADALVRVVSLQVEEGLRERFARAAEARRHAGESIEKGRLYVAAYVDFMHHAERLLQAAAAKGAHAEHGATAAASVEPQEH